MEDFQKRVVTERDELAERIRKLTGFLPNTEKFGVPTEELGRLNHQLHLMWAYLYILDERIRNF